MALEHEEEKRAFVHEILFNFQKRILDKVAEMPADWDGMELRWYLHDVFESEFMVLRDKRSRRFSEYHNFRITHGI